MFGFTLVKYDEYLNTVKIARRNIQEFRSDKESIIELQAKRIKDLETVRDYLTKDIPYYGWYIADIHKGFTDKKLKETLPEGVTPDMVENWIIDRKQGKIAILLK